MIIRPRLPAVAIGAHVLALALLVAAANAQSPEPSPAPNASNAPGGAFDGHYAGTSTSGQGCTDGDFDLIVSKGTISGNSAFKSTYKTVDHTYRYDADGRVAPDGSVKVHFHSDDDAMSVNRRDFLMTGTVNSTSMTLTQGGATCAHAVVLARK